MMMIREVNQNDVPVHDNMIRHENLDRFVNYLNVSIEKPERENETIIIVSNNKSHILVLDIESQMLE